MRVAAYVQPRRTVGRVTGVGKHVGHLPPALAALGVDVRLLAPCDQLVNGQLPAGSPLSGLPLTALPWSGRTLEWLGTLTGRPRVDRWAGGADWVYGPAESFVAVRGPRLAVTAHTSDWAEPDLPWAAEQRYRRLRWRWRLFYRAVRRRGAMVLAVSEFLRGRLIECVGLPAGRIHVVGNGVEDAFFNAGAAAAPESVQALAPYVLSVGGLTVYKGGDRLLRLATRLPDTRFLVAGTNDAELDRQAAARPNIVRLGHVAGDAMPGLMVRATAVLVLSRYETFGIPAAEALAAGVPVIASRAGALPEVLGNAGLIADADRPDGLADALKWMCDDSAGRAALVERGRRRAENFRWCQVAERVRNALAEGP